MTSRAFCALAVLTVASASRAGELEVTGIQAVHRHGQTFVTWKDVAEGEAGAKYRYSLYRSSQPITAANLDKAELCYHGVLNCSAKLFGHAFYMKDRLDPAKPYAIIEEGGKPLPPWSGLAVHTVQNPGKAYYAVVATDEKFKPVSAIVPGKSATLQAVEEKPGPIQPIKLYDSKERKSYVAQTSITGKKGLPLHVSVHGSQATGGPAGEWGDYYLYFGTPDMGLRDGMPGVFTVQENRPKDGNFLLLWPRDAIEHPSGRGAFETMWLGYYCIPHGATHKEPRYYRFTENRLLWMIDWSVKRYGADPQRISMGGSSMGGLGSINVGFRHPELFAATYPSTAPFLWWPPSSLHGLQKRDSKTLMADGKTLYADYTNSPKFAAEQHDDMPFLGWAVGRKDTNHNWQEYVDMVNALTANHHGFCFDWNDGGHSEGGRPMSTIQKYYPASKFARNRSYPAFGNSSIDSKLGSGSKDEGDREGGINLGFDWKDVVDEEGRWSVTISNDLAKEAMTVDVTPRRCQKLKLKPGTECKWTASTGASGTVTADKWGLVTVPRVAIKAGTGTVLTIQGGR
jgi:predicted esterase